MWIKKGQNEIDMTEGKLFPKILLFSLPLMASGVLQLLFNAADLVVVGRYSGEEALGAVGSTGSLVNLIVQVFMGLSVGTNVVAARFFGAQDEDGVSRTVHTSILVSLIGGIAVGVFGFLMAKPLLTLMDTPPDVLPLAVQYMKIYFIGMPACMVYNFGSAILRAEGDTRRPLYFLTAAGVLNVILNLVTVIGFHMGVSGVALATTVSQTLSAILVVICLMRMPGSFRLELRKLRVSKEILLMMAKIGLPAGLQGSIFSVSNVMIQSAVNSFQSTAVVAGNTAASNIEGFIYTIMNSVYHAAITFTGQNYGAKKYDRINKILRDCLIFVFAAGALTGVLAFVFAPQLLSIYTDKQEAIAVGMKRMSLICVTYFLCGMMDTMVGMLRGLGYSVMPMIVSLVGACGLRIVWIYTVFAQFRTLESLYISYPISWFITLTVHVICYTVVKRRLDRRIAAMQYRDAVA